MERKRVLTVQDISCVGQCSMTVALPILSACGVEACPLPTAVLSTHTGGFGRPHIRSLAEDMMPMALHWREQGIYFDAILVGYLGSAEEIGHILSVAEQLTAPEGKLIVDPAMGDHGMLYSGFDSEYVSAMKPLCAGADYLLPNLTEACLLTGEAYREHYDREWVEMLADRLLDIGCKAVILTGVSFDELHTGVLMKDGKNSEYYAHRRLKGSCHGTGDIFAAVFTGMLARGETPERAVKAAAGYVLSCMELTARENRRGYGVMFEALLPKLFQHDGGDGNRSL
ncbi:MAG: pyridoxamine kinase [Oscillospiraceae bacterium]|nr:pyridoxamine kinase [Oscillospiraceae bacterium]